MTELTKAVFLQAAFQQARRDQIAFNRANGLSNDRLISRRSTAETLAGWNEEYIRAFG